MTATLNANDDAALHGAIEKVVAITGKVQTIGTTRSGSIQFINFTGNPRGQFVGIVKMENLAAIVESLGADLKPALTRKTIELRGKVALYQDTPAIIVTSADHIRVQQ